MKKIIKNLTMLYTLMNLSVINAKTEEYEAKITKNSTCTIKTEQSTMGSDSPCSFKNFIESDEKSEIWIDNFRLNSYSVSGYIENKFIYGKNFMKIKELEQIGYDIIKNDKEKTINLKFNPNKKIDYKFVEDKNKYELKKSDYTIGVFSNHEPFKDFAGEMKVFKGSEDYFVELSIDSYFVTNYLKFKEKNKISLESTENIN